VQRNRFFNRLLFSNGKPCLLLRERKEEKEERKIGTGWKGKKEISLITRKKEEEG